MGHSSSRQTEGRHFNSRSTSDLNNDPDSFLKVTSDKYLAVPGSTGHRRSRSAEPVSPIEGPPPSYSPSPRPGEKGYKSPSRSASYLRTPMRQATYENALETLRRYNTVILVDDSGSMTNPIHAGSRYSRWDEATKALSKLASMASEYDTDGIDIYFLNSERKGLNMRDEASVSRLFRGFTPRGMTPIGQRLEDLMGDYLWEIERAHDSGILANLKQIKPVNYLIITDGAPTDDPESVIVETARRLEARNFPLTQLGIQFVQIGNEKGAAQYLQRLDDNLSSTHKIRDIVDTTPYYGEITADGLIKILLGGINRKVDKEKR